MGVSIYRRFRVLASMILLIFLLNCDKNNEQNSMDFHFPLSLENSWSYDYTFSVLYDSFAISNGLSDTTFYFSATVEIVNNVSILDSIEVFNFKTTQDENDILIYGNEYYNEDNDLLMSYGYQNASLITPKQKKEYSYIKWKGKQFDSIFELVACWNQTQLAKSDDDITYDPVIALDYPLEEDKQWSYRLQTYSGDPWRIDKKVLTSLEIDTSAGRFDCWKIQWLNNPYGSSDDWDDNLTQYDYLARIGLVKRELEIDNIECYDDENHYLGNMNYIILYGLIDYNVN